MLGEANGCGPYGENSIYDLTFSITSGRSAADGLLDFNNNNYMTTVANSSYHAFQVTLEKRLGDLRMLGAYTWAKSIDNASGFGDYINPYDHKASRSLSSFDMRLPSYTYALPFQRLAHSGGGIARAILDGWSLSGITRFTTGLPIQMGAGGDMSLCGCAGVDVPNYNGQPIQFMDPRKSENLQYFSTEQFSEEVLGVPGNANRRFFHGPGLNNWDIALNKSTRISEALSVQLRVELFNAFNHTQFTNPGGNVDFREFRAGNRRAGSAHRPGRSEDHLLSRALLSRALRICFGGAGGE